MGIICREDSETRNPNSKKTQNIKEKDKPTTPVLTFLPFPLTFSLQSAGTAKKDCTEESRLFVVVSVQFY
jgi:hypothetical protein